MEGKEWGRGWNASLPGGRLAERVSTRLAHWLAAWTPRLRLRQFVCFCVVGGSGVVVDMAVLHLFHGTLGLNLYLANLLAIGLVTLWNFGLNARFNWGKG